MLARAGEPGSGAAAARATISAWVELATEGPRKPRVAFVEALGSEALMRRRLEATRAFAQLVGGDEMAGLVAAGGLMEVMIEWVEGGLKRSGDELVDEYARLCAAALMVSRAR